MRSLPFLLRYFLLLGPLLLLAYLLQSRWREQAGIPAGADMLEESYLTHAGLAAGIVCLVFLIRKRTRHLIGFLFIAGSLVKFAIFFAFFYGPYTQDGHLGRSEFSAFFIPYVLSLILEVVFIARMLHILEKEDQGESPR